MDSLEALLKQQLDAVGNRLDGLLQTAGLTLLVTPRDQLGGSLDRVTGVTQEAEVNLHKDTAMVRRLTKEFYPPRHEGWCVCPGGDP